MNDWVCGNCKSINRGSANSCYSCGGSREIVAVSESRPLGAPPPGAAPLAAPSFGAPLGGGTLAAAGSHPGIAAPAPAAIGDVPILAGPAVEQQPRQPATTSNIVGGILAGIIAAIVATGIWYGVVAISHYQLGIVAIVVGFVVGQGVVLGAGRRGSVVLVTASIVFTLLALAISEYLIVAHFVGEALGPGATINVIQPPDFVASVVVESVKEDPLTLAFWAIALFQAFSIPARQLGRSRG